MIQPFVDKFIGAESAVKARFAEKHPSSYKDIVRIVIETINPEGDDYDQPDPERIHIVDDGDYQGTLLFLIAATDYQPSNYWYVKVGYGSCSGCDTLQEIRDYSDDPPTPEQVKDYWTLALHVVQGLKAMQDDAIYE